MKLRSISLLLSLSLALSLISVAKSADYDCVYTIYVRTGSILKGGTDSKISASLFTAAGDGIAISDLEAWAGLMGPGYNYFERGNLDIFSGRGPCLEAPICKLNLTSDGSGDHHGWYVNYVEVTSTGPHVPCQQVTFTVEQWLALDTWPYKLSTVRDYCAADDGALTLGSEKKVGNVVSVA